MCFPALGAQVESACLVPNRQAWMGRDMWNAPGMKNHAGAGGHQRIGMKLLVSECGHVALVAGNELIVVVHLVPKAGTRMMRRTKRHLLLQRFECAVLGLKHRITSSP